MRYLSQASRRNAFLLDAGFGGRPDPNANKSQQPAAGSVTFVSDQFQPVDEAEKMRKRILAGLQGDHRVELPAGAAPSPSQGGDTLVGIRAENIRPATEPSPGALPARVQVVEPLGSHLPVTVSIGAQQLKVVAPIDFPARPERDLWLRLDPDRLRLFEVGSGERVPA
jgi:ABC-type sugar transport system ATPase subunit